MSNLILVAGIPASGKSRFAAYAAKRLKYTLFSKDDLKECLFDAVGFNSHEEKRRLDAGATACMLYSARKTLAAGRSVVLDNNFLSRDISLVEAVVEKYRCRVVTVRFGGEIHAIFERYEKRDRENSRHRGHALNCRYPEIPGMDEEEKASRETLKSFEAKYRERGAFDFAIGALITVDATDFEKISYEDILRQIQSLLKEQ